MMMMRWFQDLSTPSLLTAIIASNRCSDILKSIEWKTVSIRFFDFSMMSSLKSVYDDIQQADKPFPVVPSMLFGAPLFC